MKTLKTILAAAVVLGFLAACSEQNAPADQSSAKQTTTKTTYSSKIGTQSTKEDTAK